MTFEKLGLSEPVMRGVRAAGYLVPTEIQALAIPAALSGGDVIGRAKTGSGKTAAFVLPVLDRLIANGSRKPNGVRALVLTPTRELAQQVADATQTYARHLKLRGDAMYGGVSIEPQFKRLRPGLDILAATPGRLLDHIERGSVDLSQCEVLIVDEADRMFDMGFINDVKRIISKLPRQRQTMLFSATMSKEVRTLTASIMNKPLFVEVGVEGNPAESVRQHFFSVQKAAKYDFLHHLLTEEKEMDSVLVFSRTKHGANKIAKRLSRSGIVVGVLHSDRSQSQRQQALDGFRQGRLRVLIATDIAARGIDVRGISHVINFDTPNFAEDYVHRIGRTGRADATGDAITFVASDERDHLRRIERFVGRRYDVQACPHFVAQPDLEPAHQERTPREYGNRNGQFGRGDRQDRPQQKRRESDSRAYGVDTDRKPGDRKNGGDRTYNRDRKFDTERPSNGDRKFAGERPFNGERKTSGERPFNSDRKNGGDRTFNRDRKFAGERPFNGDRKTSGERPFNGERKTGGERPFNGERKTSGERSFTADAPREAKNGKVPERYFASNAAPQGEKKRPAPHRKKGGPSLKAKKRGTTVPRSFDGERKSDSRRRDPRF
ncbi:MAG: DEAD/DEAH box helicase [Bacteroidetes bacterium]|nr:DEAD/DEAH box helicase [Bacteroidota bacterium]